MSVSERPEQPEREGAPAGRGNARTSGNGRAGKRGRPRRAALSSPDEVDVTEDVGLNSVVVANGGFHAWIERDDAGQ